MLNAAWTLSLLALFPALLTNCAGASFSPGAPVVTPEIVQYSETFQQQLANEIDRDKRIVCPRDIPVPGCSAWKRAVVDYGTMREQVRAANAATAKEP